MFNTLSMFGTGNLGGEGGDVPYELEELLSKGIWAQLSPCLSLILYCSWKDNFYTYQKEILLKILGIVAFLTNITTAYIKGL